MSANKTPVRYPDIDRAKGLAMLLVVFGHVVARQPPANNEWYVIAKSAVYSFHMAFFMFLSGVVFFVRLRLATGGKDFMLAVNQRFMRLMPAYFLFAIIVFFGKYVAQHYVYVDNPVKSFSDVLNIILYPMQSVSSFLWYIYVLFVISAVSLGFVSITNGRLWPLVLVGIILLLFVPSIDFLAFGQISKYLLFFSLGGMAARYWDRYIRLVVSAWVPACILLMLMLSLKLYDGYLWVIVALLSIPALHGICRSNITGGRFLLAIGTMTFPIYLMNTIAIGTVKAVMLKISGWDGANFFVFFPALFISGIVLPVLVKKYLFVHVPWLNRITS